MEIEIELTGVSPLIINKFTDAAAQAATDGVRGSSAGQERLSPREDCESRLHIGQNGEPCIPSYMMMASVAEGGKFEKIGKAQVTTKDSSLLYGCLEIEEIEIYIIHVRPWDVFQKDIRNPSTKGRMLRYRPIFYDWKLRFTMRLDTSVMNEKTLRRIIDHAGTKKGLGDFRPGCKGPYGKYVVTHWKRNILDHPERILAAE